MKSIGRRKTMWWFTGDAKVKGVRSPRPISARMADGLTARPGAVSVLG